MGGLELVDLAPGGRLTAIDDRSEVHTDGGPYSRSQLGDCDRVVRRRDDGHDEVAVAPHLDLGDVAPVQRADVREIGVGHQFRVNPEGVDERERFLDSLRRLLDFPFCLVPHMGTFFRVGGYGQSPEYHK